LMVTDVVPEVVAELVAMGPLLLLTASPEAREANEPGPVGPAGFVLTVNFQSPDASAVAEAVPDSTEVSRDSRRAAPDRHQQGTATNNTADQLTAVIYHTVPLVTAETTTMLHIQLKSTTANNECHSAGNHYGQLITTISKSSQPLLSTKHQRQSATYGQLIQHPTPNTQHSI
jgi:hypothetical protein